MDYLARLERLQTLLESSQLDGLIYGTGANLQYFTGLAADWQREHEPEDPQLLLLLASGREPLIVSVGKGGAPLVGPVPVAAVPSRSELAAAVRHWLPGRRIGVGRSGRQQLSRMILEALPEATCASAEALGEGLRYCKDAEEIGLLRRAAQLTDAVMSCVVERIRPGITQPELQALITASGQELGAQAVSFPAAALYVKSGTAPGSDPFVYPQADGLVPGTSVAFDFGFVLEGYCSDFGRSFYCGEAPEEIAHAYRVLQVAQADLVGQMRPGLPIGQLSDLLEAYLDRYGLGDRFRARVPDGTLGHQIGVDLHENPWIRRDCQLALQPGMVMAIEPKLWLPGEYYLRVEDLVLITEQGAEFLTHFDREQFALPV